jgi:hypothetical protein
MKVTGRIVNGRIEVDGVELPEGATVTIELLEGPSMSPEEEAFVEREYEASFDDDLVPVSEVRAQLRNGGAPELTEEEDEELWQAHLEIESGKGIPAEALLAKLLAGRESD